MASSIGSRSFWFGFITGFGSGMIAREAFPHFKNIASPVFKSLLKSSMTAGERSREMMSRMGEIFQDIFAEVQEDLKNEKKNRSKLKKKKTKFKKKTGSDDLKENIIDLTKRRSTT